LRSERDCAATSIPFTIEGAWLRKDGANVVIELDGAERGRVSVHMIGALVCSGRVGMLPPLMGYCAEQGVCIPFMTE